MGLKEYTRREGETVMVGNRKKDCKHPQMFFNREVGRKKAGNTYIIKYYATMKGGLGEGNEENVSTLI